MATDPYATLGVKRDATADEIRAAYRKLAKTHHPDLNPGNKTAEEKFKAIATANDLLSDPDKRARFDRGEIDGTGTERAPRDFYRNHADGAQGRAYRPAPGEPDLSDIFQDFLRNNGAAGGRARAKMRGDDQMYQLAVGWLEAINGASKRLTLPDGRTLDVNIPAGVEDGQSLRLRGQGGAGWNEGAAGDAIIEVAVQPHPFFTRDGDDVTIDLPITIAEAVLGARVAVPTPSGPVTLSVPPHSDTGRRLRLRGRGVPAHAGRPAGDLYALLRVVVGETDAALEQALGEWMARSPQNPRHAMESA